MVYARDAAAAGHGERAVLARTGIVDATLEQDRVGAAVEDIEQERPVDVKRCRWGRGNCAGTTEGCQNSKHRGRPRAFLGYVHGRLLPRVVDEEQVFVAPPRDAAKVGALALEGKPQARRLGRRS